MNVPILANITEFGVTPLFTADEPPRLMSRWRFIRFRIPCDERGCIECVPDNTHRRFTEKLIAAMQTRAELYDYRLTTRMKRS